MYIKLAVATLATLQLLILIGDELLRRTPYQSDVVISNKISSGEKSSMSDREKAGIRGPAQQCTEVHTNPAFENVPAWTYRVTTKYSPEGRILQSTTSNSVESGLQEFSTTYTYDSAGRLLKKTTTNTGSPASESEVLLPASTAYEFPVPEDEDPYLPIPAGGQAKISYNEQDQPIEWQVSDANGNLLNRLIRTYDENGRLAELRYTMENILLTSPAEAQQQFLADPAAAEEL